MEEEQHQSVEQRADEPGVKNSIKKLKEKFLPGFNYVLFISAAFNFAMLVIGCLNVHKCPVNKNIPLFLIATGAIGLVSKFVSYIRNRFTRHVQIMYLESALYSVELVFFILGTYWVYKEFQPSYNSYDENYCNKTAYMFAFIYVTIYYAIIIAIICGFCCFVCCAMFLLQIGTRTGNSGKYNVEAPGEQTETGEVATAETPATKTENEAKPTQQI